MEIRRQKILNAIVKEYIKRAEPIGSGQLLHSYHFNISPATIRNEMKELENDRYIYQPHTSAGRVPTDKGYRFYVDQIMIERDLPSSEKKQITKEFQKLQAQYQNLSRVTAKLLSALTNNLAISMNEEEGEAIDSGISQLFKQPEFADSLHSCKMAEGLEWLEENLREFMKEPTDDLRVLIGEENPTKYLSDCSMIMARYQSGSGEKGYLAVVGPKRMKYNRTIPLMDFMQEFLKDFDNF